MEQRVLHALTKCPLFAGMTSVEIEVSMAGVSYSIVNYDSHDIYALTGMPCKTLDIVVRGVLVCRMSSLSGRQVEVSRLREGNLVAPAFIFGKDNNAFLTHRMRVLSLFTVKEKVAYLLLERAGEQGSNVVHLSRSRQEIADSFGIQKFSLLRVLADFAKAGAIRINGREVTILDRSKMR